MRHLSVVLVLGVASCATAPRPATPSIKPAIAPALKSLDFYVGTWSCKGTSFSPTHKEWNAEVRVAPELDGTWLSVQMIGPGDNHTIEHKGFDPVTKHFVHVAVGPEGSWTTLQSPGWDGTHMVFAPDDKADHTRATFTRIDERHYSHAVSSESGEKQWEKICTKQS